MTPSTLRSRPAVTACSTSVATFASGLRPRRSTSPSVTACFERTPSDGLVELVTGFRVESVESAVQAASS